MMTIHDRPPAQVAPPVALNVDRSSPRGPMPGPGGHEAADLRLPEHLTRKLAPTRPHSSDPVSRRIANLLSLHPDIDRDYVSIDLRRMLPAPKRVLLREIEARLGIA